MCIMCNSYEDAHCTSVIRSQKTDTVVDTKFQTNSQDMGQVRSTNLPFIRRSVENRQFAKKVTKILNNMRVICEMASFLWWTED